MATVFLQPVQLNIIRNPILAKQSIKNEKRYSQYLLMLSFVEKSLTTFDIELLPPFLQKLSVNEKANLEFQAFIRLIQDLYQMNIPTHYALSRGMLVAFLEGLLDLPEKNELVLRFCLTLTFFLEDKGFEPILSKLYDARSKFFHSAK